VYGLPELFRSEIPRARLVANPGCYPTSAILPLAPLIQRGIVQSEGIIVDSKSGVSGAGRTPKLTTHFPECNESVSAYNVGRHRHTPEIDQVLSVSSGRDVGVIFTPHLIPMDRGILTTTYSVPKQSISEEKVLETLRDFYADEPFVRVVDHLPGTKDSGGSNFCDITARVVRGRVITISCLDNLIKGAAGAAVQNFNLMFGYPEITALL
jgi:N-acetyl-gamma-glutamyl-phosphate reductase